MQLQDIFEMQKKLNEKCAPGLYEGLTPEKMVDWVVKFNLAMQQEQAELIDSLPWKWWKKGQFNLQNAKVELVDILHFWVSMCTILGMTADEVFELYAKKNNLNHKRQENGYKDGTYQKIVDGVEDNERL